MLQSNTSNAASTIGGQMLDTEVVRALHFVTAIVTLLAGYFLITTANKPKQAKQWQVLWLTPIGEWQLICNAPSYSEGVVIVQRLRMISHINEVFSVEEEA